MTDQELMDMAKKAAEYAYVPYSKFPVGAALECSDGTIFTGCNVENAAYGDTICAAHRGGESREQRPPRLCPHRHLGQQQRILLSLRLVPPVSAGIFQAYDRALRQERRELREPQALGDDAVFLRLLIASKKNTAEDQI